MFYWDQQLRVGWVSSGYFLVGLVDHLFQPASNQVEKLEKLFA